MDSTEAALITKNKDKRLNRSLFAYELQIGEPFWMPEIGLGIGRCRLLEDPLDREILSWYDDRGDRYLNEAETERQRAEAERQRAEQLAQRLRELGEEV